MTPMRAFRPFAAAAALALAGLASGLASGLANAAAPGPEDVVKSTADRLFTELDKNRDALKADPSKVNPLVEQILLPNFDVDYATRLVLAKYWRSVPAEQQVRFQKAFIGFLVRTYGKAVIGFERDRIKFKPMRGPLNPKNTAVQTEIARSGGAPIPVDYVLRQMPDGSWKVFDIVIEGISYVRNYNQSFGDEIEREGRGNPTVGLEAVIKRLESGAFQAPDAAKPATAPKKAP